jgi:hypothetical protein
MSKRDQMNINIKVDDENEVKITLSEEEKSRIPRPGESIYVVEPYPVDDDEDENDQEDVKQKPILAYSYTGVMAKSVVLSDDLDEVRVNGDYVISLKKESSSSRKLMVFSSEEEALDKYRALMSVSVKEAGRRLKKAQKIADYLEEALDKNHH